MQRGKTHGHHDTEGAALASLLRSSRGAMTPATEFLDDRDRPEQDDERQDAPELEGAADDRENAVARRPGRGGRRILAEAGRIDARVRVSARRTQCRQRAPAAPIVVLNLLERAGREA